MEFHRRRLPHLQVIGEPVFVTWRLYGSLPDGRYFPPDLAGGAAFVALDRLLDNARTGPIYLKRAEIASMVVKALRYHAGVLGQYQLHQYVVMANHVHVLITPGVPLAKVMQSLKRFTAREANLMLGLTGQRFWQDESYDRFVRNNDEFHRIARYIEMNPVRAGLVATPDQFPWSSAAGAD